MSELQIYNLKNVFALRNRLIMDTCSRYYNLELVGDDFSEFVEDVWRAMPAGVQLDSVFESLRSTAGHELDQSLLESVMWRLAGNVLSLKAGLAAPIWTANRSNEWVPFQVIRVQAALNGPKRRRGHLFTLRALAGGPASELAHKFWSRPACTVAAKSMGFSKSYTGKYPYSHPRQLVGLRFYGFVEASRSHEMGGPGFFKTECPSSCLKYNRETLTMRLGPRPESCPQGYLHDCHKCVIGYIECLAGTHRETYTRSVCASCGHLSVFDPESSAGKCVSCEDSYAGL
jgi:hypothetical protein